LNTRGRPVPPLKFQIEVNRLDALILAAGDGTRLRPYTQTKPKVMIEIWGVPVLERLLYALKEAGIKRAVIVVSYKKEIIQNYFGSEWRGMEIVYREVDYHDDGILRSAIMGREVMNGRFVFVCGDTILEPETVTRAIMMSGDLVVGVRNVNIDEAVGALVDEKGKVTEIGMMKDMKKHNRVVTGIAVAESSFFEGMEKCIEQNIFDRPCAMQWVVEQGYDVTAFDMTEDCWWEIDNESDLEKAKEEIFERSWKKRFTSRDINVFKRLFNLPISLNLVKLLSRTAIRPSHLNLISLGFALAAGVFFMQGHFITGGIFSYACAMADALDGKLSRLKLLSSPEGGFYDSVCDRAAEIAIVSGLAMGLYEKTSTPIVLLLGLLALTGWLGRFYLKELFIHMSSLKAWKSLSPIPLDLFGHRDVTFFITMISCFAGYPLVPLVWMALWGNLFSAINFIQYKQYLRVHPLSEDYRSR
jgi:choline kinase/phosphatidylglycerophosphate synthase